MFLKLGRLSPSHVNATGKPDDQLVLFDFCALEDRLDFEDGLMPAGAMFGDVTRRSGGLGHSPLANLEDPPNHDGIRRGDTDLQFLIPALPLNLTARAITC